MASGDLRAVLRIKHMAAEAGREPEKGYALPSASYEMAAAYVRLREEARLLNERAGWSAEEFDRDVPAPDWGELPRPDDNRASYQLVSVAAPRARFLLRQLSAWAAGHVEAFEIEERLKANAAAQVEAERGRGRRVGFGSDE